MNKNIYLTLFLFCTACTNNKNLPPAPQPTPLSSLSPVPTPTPIPHPSSSAKPKPEPSVIPTPQVTPSIQTTLPPTPSIVFNKINFTETQALLSPLHRDNSAKLSWKTTGRSQCVLVNETSISCSDLLPGATASEVLQDNIQAFATGTNQSLFQQAGDAIALQENKESHTTFFASLQQKREWAGFSFYSMSLDHLGNGYLLMDDGRKPSKSGVIEEDLGQISIRYIAINNYIAESDPHIIRSLGFNGEMPGITGYIDSQGNGFYAYITPEGETLVDHFQALKYTNTEALTSLNSKQLHTYVSSGSGALVLLMDSGLSYFPIENNKLGVQKKITLIKPIKNSILQRKFSEQAEGNYTIQSSDFILNKEGNGAILYFDNTSKSTLEIRSIKQEKESETFVYKAPQNRIIYDAKVIMKDNQAQVFVLTGDCLAETCNPSSTILTKPELLQGVIPS